MIKQDIFVVAVLATLVATACSDAAETSVINVTTSSTLVTATTSDEPTAITATDPGQRADAGPLYLGVSIHVEGWDEEDRNEAMFDRHVTGLLMMAEVAGDLGAVFTFELSEVFMDAVVRWGSDVVERLHAFGQGTGIHADIGGRGDPTLEELVAPLTRMREKAASIGVDTRHVSGICSRGPWVEAALEAGFQSINGAVEYCATSLDPASVPDGWDLSGCTSPAVCHGSLQVNADAKIHPYLIDSSADFLTPSDSGLVLMIGNSGEAVDCAGEGKSGGGGCVGDDDDLPFAKAALEEFLEDRDPSRVAALTMSWSVGSIPDEGFVSALIEVFEDAVGRGEAVWAAVGDIGRAAMEHLEGPGAGEIGSGEQAIPAVDDGGEEVLPIVVSIHSHFTKDYQPYANAGLRVLDEANFAQLQNLIVETAATLADHSVLANWQLSYGVARALCSDDDTGIVDMLLGEGHEIGVHVHSLDDLDRAAAEVAECGIEVTAVSGLTFTTGSARRGDVLSAALSWLEAVEDAGFDTVLAALGDGSNPLDFACGRYDGAIYDTGAGALLHSWVLSPDDPCTADADGSLTVVTHTSLPQVGGGSPRGPSDVTVGSEHATIWSEWLSVALASSTDTSTWGLVVPFPIMKDEAGASDDFLNAFDVILGEIAEAVAAGEAVSVTAAEAAAIIGALSP